MKDKARWEAVNPVHISRETDGVEWLLDGEYVLHERDRFSFSFFKQISSEYWPEHVYSDLALAKEHAARFGGTVTECFYSEPGTLWFIRFSEMLKAVAYCEFMKDRI